MHPPKNDILTLAGMLRRFCAEERVGELSKGYECSNCGGGPGVVSLISLVISFANLGKGGHAQASDQETRTSPLVSAQSPC